MITPSVLAVMEYAGVYGELDTVLHKAAELDVLPLARQIRGLPPTLQSRALQMIQEQATQDAVAVLSTLPFTILKGAPLGAQLFGSSCIRTTTDVDALVHPNDVTTAQSLLRGQGYICQYEAVRPLVDNQQPWTHPTLPIVIELHWSVALPTLPQPPVAFFLPFQDQGLPPIPLLFQLVLHFHNHGGFLKGLIDIAAWWDLFGGTVDWEDINAIASDHGMRGLIAWPLELLEHITGCQTYRHSTSLAVSLWTGWTLESLQSTLRKDAITSSFSGLKAGLPAWASLLNQAMLAGLFDNPIARLKALGGPLWQRARATKTANCSDFN